MFAGAAFVFAIVAIAAASTDYPGGEHDEVIRCPENTTYTRCDHSCQPNCASLATPQRCVKMCVPGCRCDEGFLLNGNRCVPEAECSEAGHCRENEYYGWGNNCVTCRGRKFLCPEVDQVGCFCESGFVFDEERHRCVPAKECQPH